MKKNIAILLVFAMLFILCACNSTASQDTLPTDPTDQSVPTGVTDPTGTTDSTDPTETTETTDATVATDATDPTDSDDSKDPTNATQTGTSVIETKPAQCTHKFEKATCTKPMTCTLCGATEGKALGHNWKRETCTAPKTCSECGATEGDKAPHQWKDATCTAPKTCRKCGATEGSAAGHQFSEGFCVVCNEAAPKSAIEDFTNGWWITKVVVPEEDAYGEILLSLSFDASEALTYAIKSYYEYNPYEEQVFGQVEYNGKTYLDVSFSGSMGGFEFEELPDGNVKVIMMNETEFELTRVTAKEFKVVACNDQVFLPVGTILTNRR